jgi:hypothetical protein
MAAAVFAWMSGGAAWACVDSCDNTEAPAEAVIACEDDCNNTEASPQAEVRIASCGDGDCRTDPPPQSDTTAT